jgi:hypothetical protein
VTGEPDRRFDAVVFDLLTALIGSKPFMAGR